MQHPLHKASETGAGIDRRREVEKSAVGDSCRVESMQRTICGQMSEGAEVARLHSIDADHVPPPEPEPKPLEVLVLPKRPPPVLLVPLPPSAEPVPKPR